MVPRDILPLPDLFEKILGEDRYNWPPEACLLVAADEGNLRRIKEIAATLNDEGLGIPATVARTTFHGMSAMHAASELHVYRYLIEVANMDANKPDSTPDRKTPLEQAIAGGHLPAVRYLIDHGADIHVERERNITVLHTAAKKGRTEIVKLLLSRGAHVDGKSNYTTPLYLAATKGYESTVRVLLEYKADPNKAVASGRETPLAAALSATSLPCVKLLIQAGADVNDKNNPLALAAEGGLTEAMKWLLEAGANPNCPDMMKTSDLKQQGNDAFEKHDYVNASEWYTQALKVDPCDATLLSKRCVCWLRMGEGKKALEDAKKCIENRPNWSEAYQRLGEALMLKKKACVVFTRGLELDPLNDEMDKLFWEAMDLKQ
uniref:Serine/threonine-protein kinase BSK1-like TPR repeats domain-containing protein n=1 Tax=Leersia perrieri TaxID=77586 RepID=A0A0D9Y1S6_9ORYZ